MNYADFHGRFCEIRLFHRIFEPLRLLQAVRVEFCRTEILEIPVRLIFPRIKHDKSGRSVTESIIKLPFRSGEEFDEILKGEAPGLMIASGTENGH